MIRLPLSSIVLALFACSAPLLLAAQATPAARLEPAPHRPTPEQRTIQATEQTDRQHLLDMLDIKGLRPPSVHWWNPGEPHAANYDEAKAGAY